MTVKNNKAEGLFLFFVEKLGTVPSNERFK
jgi:hypothetical protein